MTAFQQVLHLQGGPYGVILADPFLEALRDHLSRHDGPTEFSFRGIRRKGEDGRPEIEITHLMVGYVPREQQVDGWLTLGSDPATASRDAEVVAAEIDTPVLGGTPFPRLVMVSPDETPTDEALRLWVAPAAAPHRAVPWDVPLPRRREIGRIAARGLVAAIAAALLVRLAAFGIEPRLLGADTLLPMGAAAGAALLAALALQWVLSQREVRRAGGLLQTVGAEPHFVVGGSEIESKPSASRESEPADGGRPQLENGTTATHSITAEPAGRPVLFRSHLARRWTLDGSPWSDAPAGKRSPAPLLRLLWTREALSQLAGHARQAVRAPHDRGEHEIGGVLLGKIGWDEWGRRTGLVRLVDRLEEAEAGPFRVGLSAISLEDRREQGWDVLGTFHTHVSASGMGVSPSHEDLETFRKIIADEAQAMAILDTERMQLGLYTWGADEGGMRVFQAPELLVLDAVEGESLPFGNYRPSSQSPAIGEERANGPCRDAERLLDQLAALGESAAPVLEALRRTREGEHHGGK